MHKQDDSVFVPNELRAFSGYYVNQDKLRNSSSGGGASALAEAIIGNGGCVFGVAYTDNFKRAEYYCAESMEDLEKLKGSKYIETDKRVFYNNEYQSVYSLVYQKLKESTEVLFIGVGCAVSALYSYLLSQRSDISGLYTAEVICYGPTSQKVSAQYIDSLEQRFDSKIISFTVRHKKGFWLEAYVRAEFASGTVFEEPFYRSDYGYALSVYSRLACYNCRFKGHGHPADLILGDYRGLSKHDVRFNPLGVSVFIVRTEKGNRLMSKLDRTTFCLSTANIDHVLKHNEMYYANKKRTKKREEFGRLLDTEGLHKAVVKCSGRLRYRLKNTTWVVSAIRHLKQLIFFRDKK